MTPQLRFPAFTDKWQLKKLGDIARVVTGSTPSTADMSLYGDEFLFISPADMNSGRYVTNTRTKLSQKGFEKSRPIPVGSTLFVCIGSTIGKTAQATIECTTNQQINSVIGDDNNVDDDFVYLALSRLSRRISLLAGEQAVPIISKGEFQKTKLSVPSKPEQEKIAEFLTLVDERIAAGEKKLELLQKYKKGVMQKIFTQAIRFRDENGNPYPEWEKKRLGDLFDRVTDKNKENNQNVLTISAQQGLISQTDFFSKIVAAKNVTNYFMLTMGDFAYNKSYSAGYPMGAIKKLNLYTKGIVSTLYICFRAKDSNDNDFFEQVFVYGLQDSEIEKVAQEGARNHGLLNIGVSDFFNIELTLPKSKEEQQKIAALLIALDDKIAAEQTRLTAAKQWKKGLLQRMFI
ncbi:restriction endonuclease subunit S [Candidatus Mycosynbacter amalyticus]|uniref:Restriction endonuclease subunit S n=1 Tax=Candidatus Mycosynbacter amalyticus TaxID=2665156 RepID=A0A857MKL4_9BACT|nr:restriction endonuclease subunit S [Candidatus Mycosynbacter amalyticus]QHN42678.1 restriction endonuclease subunit S [Candidatus Mycosynbacter amalyticus]